MRSMTGYGQARGEIGGRQLAIEVRCTNHRYCEVRVLAGRGWSELEVRLEQKVRTWLLRGRAECQVHAAGGAPLPGRPVLDESCACEYLKAYERLARTVWAETGKEYQPTLEMLARADGVLLLEEGPGDAARAWEQMAQILDQALSQADSMRQEEGRQLQQELRLRRQSLSALTEQLDRLVPQETKRLRERAQPRGRAGAGEPGGEPGRLEQELALLAERSDVREEMVRLQSHIGQFDSLLDVEGPAGKQLDFLLQEMMREANTICAKVRSADVVRTAVELKTEIERAREQVQNVL